MKNLWYLVLLVLASCSLNPNDFQPKNFTDEVDVLQNLHFTFNKDAGEISNDWTDSSFIQFKPAIKGKFRWLSKRELVFSPAAPLKPATNYSANLELKNFKQNHSNKSIEFHTPYLKIEKTESWWHAENGNLSNRIALIFNYSVEPNRLKSLIKVQADGKNIPVEMISNGKNNRIVMSLEGLKLSPEEANTLSIEVGKGMGCTESDWSSAEIMQSSVQIPQRSFEILKTEAKHLGTSGSITLIATENFNEKIVEDIHIEPKVNFTVNYVDNRATIEGEFIYDQSYELKIDSGAVSAVGDALKEAYIQNIGFEEPQASLEFAVKKGMILPSKGSKNVAINLVNVNEVRVKINKIFENNLVPFFRENAYSITNGYEVYFKEDYGEKIFERDYSLKDLQKIGNSHLLNLNFEDIFQTNKGIYLVEISSNTEYYVRSSKVIAISDIGLMARKAKDDIWVMAHALGSTENLTNMDVSLISISNQLIYKAKTNAQGIAIFKNVPELAKNFKPSMLTASIGSDLAFLDLNQMGVEMSRFETSGKSLTNAFYDAYLYGEREIYRPDETANFHAIVRTPEWKNVNQMPVYFRLVSPTGQIQKFSADLGPESSADAKFIIPADGMTGIYSVDLFNGNNDLLTSTSISVEEFLPDRIRVQSDFTQKSYLQPDSLNVEFSAHNLIGTPAIGRNYELVLQMKKRQFRPKGYDNWLFDTYESSYIEEQRKVGKTSEKAKESLTFKLPATLKNHGLLEAVAYTTVLDETGRPVHRVSSAEVYTQNAFLGIKTFDPWVNAGSILNIPVASVNSEGKPMSAVTAKIQVIHHQWENVLEKNYSGFKYVSKKKSKKIQEKIIQLNGISNFAFTPWESGDYEVRLSYPGVKNYISFSFFAYGWGSVSTGSFEVNNDGHILISTDKSKYKIGESCKILFKTPFEGKIIATLEREGVLQYAEIQTKNNSATLTVPLKEGSVPNVFVTATLIRPVTQDHTPFMVAHGFQNVIVENPFLKIPVSIQANKEVRSQTKQRITVQTLPFASLTIAVVDEGILQIKNTASPDPYQYFYSPRALSVQSLDCYPYILPELKSHSPIQKSKTGGSDAEMKRRLNPLTSKRARLVSFWSGRIVADAYGNANFDVNLPTFSGSVRIMAASYKANQFGAASQNMIVADPVVISAGLPRFLSPADSIYMPLTLMNTTKQNITANVKIIGSGLIQVQSSASLIIPQKGEATQLIPISALAGIGEGKVKIVVNALNQVFQDEISLPVRPSAPLQQKTQSGSVASGQNITIQTNHNFIASSRKSKLLISKNPMAEFSKDLSELLEYPHGCLEQTISTAFPQMYYADLANAINSKKVLKGNAKQNVQAAIDKIQSMQKWNGGLSYWPEMTESHFFGSAYALHFLIEAKQAGFLVNEQVMTKISSYLQSQIKNSKNDETKEKISSVIFYAMYVLSLNGQSQTQMMNYYKSKLNQLNVQSKYLLACTYAKAGDFSIYNMILPSSAEIKEYRDDEFFGTQFRDKALLLNVLIETSPDNNQIPQLVNEVSTTLKNTVFLSTQERVWAFLALGKFAKRNLGKNPTGKIVVNGKTLKFTGTDIVIKETIQGNIEISASGTGNIYYFFENSGIPADGKIPQEDKGIQVRKTYFDRSGKPIAAKQVHVGEVIVVKLSVKALNNDEIANVAIADLIPAGFEIENARISSIQEFEWTQKDGSSYDNMDVRDDRIHYFSTITGKPSNYYYVLRAVTPGQYQTGSCSADAMNYPAIHSYSGAGMIKVVKN